MVVNLCNLAFFVSRATIHHKIGCQSSEETTHRHHGGWLARVLTSVIIYELLELSAIVRRRLLGRSRSAAVSFNLFFFRVPWSCLVTRNECNWQGGLLLPVPVPVLRDTVCSDLFADEWPKKIFRGGFTARVDWKVRGIRKRIECHWDLSSRGQRRRIGAF